MFKFSKMHGAGNDFIVIDKTELPETVSGELAQKLCERYRGIGADGLIVLSKSPETPDCINMLFFNCDGSRAEMCGNGLRCATKFASKYMTDGIASLQFVTDSGNISTVINGEQVKVEIPFSEEFTEFILKDGSKVYKGITGVPHAVKLVNRVENVDINEAGKQIRFAECFAPAGANVDFIQVPLEPTDPVLIRTYERGVEAETNACGTGICAAAIVLNRFFDFGNKIKFLTPDKELLTVDLEIKDKVIVKVFLTGPAVEVYRGELLEMQ